MNAVDQLLDLKAVLVENVTEENLFAFSIALLDAPLFIPCMFQMSELDPDFSDIAQFVQGTVLAWQGPDYKPVTVELAEKNWLRVYTEKSAMPEQYKNSCVSADGRFAVKLAHEQNSIDGLMLDPEGRFIPIPLEYLDEVIQIIDDHKGDKMSDYSDPVEAAAENNGSFETAGNDSHETEDNGPLESLNFDSLEITDIIGLKDGFIIRWCSPEIGFGEYTIHTKVKRNEFGFAEDDVLIEGESECMDVNENKAFLKALFDKLLEKINIIS